ncbi:MAG: GT4 family glycosyltransferase PelF [Gammaproteobacteria bacterium]
MTCRLADRIICLNEGDRSAAAARGIPMTNAVVIPNGIDPRPFDGVGDRRAELGIGLTAPVAGMIARLVPQKDPLMFVQMARIVADRLPSARFLIVGDGPLRAHMIEAMNSLGLQSQVQLLGFRTDIPELLASMDVVVLTSRWEGMPLVALEAMAAGKPVVATFTSGIAEAVVHRETGWIAGPGDLHGVADAVFRLLNDPERRAEMGYRGRTRAWQYFTVEGMVDATVRVYRAAAEYAQAKVS